MEDAPEPVAELDEERPVEPERAPDAGDVGRGGLVAGDQRRRVAGGQVQEAEHEQGHEPHHGDRGDDAPGDVDEQR